MTSDDLGRRITPSLSLCTTRGTLHVLPACPATPLTLQEHRSVCEIFQGRVREVRVVRDGRRRAAATFKSSHGSREWTAALFVDERGQPLRLKAGDSQRQLELRWLHPADEHWLQFARYDGPPSVVEGFLALLRSEGGMAELLASPGDARDGTCATGLLAPVSAQCLRSVLLSMSGRKDDVGRRVCDALVTVGATPATLHQLTRTPLAAVLSMPGLHADVSDLRWWPSACVSRLIDRLAHPFASWEVRAFFRSVQRISEAAGNGNVWPEVFTGGGLRAQHEPVHSPQLRLLLAQYFLRAEKPQHRTTANVLLRLLESAYSVAERPRTVQDVVRLDDGDLRHLGVSPFGIHHLKSPGCLLGWLHAHGGARLEDLLAMREARAHDGAWSDFLLAVLLPNPASPGSPAQSARRCEQDPWHAPGAANRHDVGAAVPGRDLELDDIWFEAAPEAVPPP